MEAIRVYVNKQMDGMAFSLSPNTRRTIGLEFPDAVPTGSVFVNYDTKLGFDAYHGKIEKFIVPVLLGMSEAEVAKLGKISFLDPVTNAVIYSYPE